MKFPSSKQYKTALKDIGAFFLPKEIKVLSPRKNSRGEPRCEFYKQSCIAYLEDSSGKKWILKLFNQHDNARDARYTALKTVLPKLSKSSRYFIDFEYFKEAIEVDGERFPALLMEEITGKTMNRLAKDYISEKNTDALSRLAGKIISLSKSLYADRVTHGDIHFENIFILENGDIKLIDYDDIFVAEKITTPSDVTGHENFSHPKRTKVHYGIGVDNFSFWITIASIHIFISDLSLWDIHDGDQAWLFTKADFTDPRVSQIFLKLSKSKSKEVHVWLAVILNNLLGYDNPLAIPPLEKTNHLTQRYRHERTWSPVKEMYDPFKEQWIDQEKTQNIKKK